MNRYIYIKHFLIAVTTILIIGCGTDSEIFVPDPIDGNIQEFFDGEHLPVERFNVNTSIQNVIVTNDKSLLVIQPNSIIDANGNAVSGDVTVEVIKSDAKGDLILANVQSVAYDRLLNNLYNFKVNILQEGKRLTVSEETPIEVNIKTDVFLWNLSLVDLFKYDERVSAFYETDENTSENNSIYYGDWEYETETGVEFGSGYRMEVTESGWYSIASYLSRDNNSATNVCVQLPEELFNGHNSVIYAIVGQTNTLIKLDFSPENKYFCDQMKQIQENENIKFVSIASSGEKDKFFLGIQDEIIFENINYVIVPKKQTIEQIKLQLEEI